MLQRNNDWFLVHVINPVPHPPAPVWIHRNEVVAVRDISYGIKDSLLNAFIACQGGVQFAIIETLAEVMEVME